MQSRLIGTMAGVCGMSIGWFGFGLKGLQLQVYMVFGGVGGMACDFLWIFEMKMGLEEEQMGKKVQDVEQIDRDNGWCVWDEYWMVWVWLGGFVVADLHGLVVVLVA